MNNKIVVIFLLLITAGIAFGAEDWNLAGTSTFTGVNTTDLNVSGDLSVTGGTSTFTGVNTTDLNVSGKLGGVGFNNQSFQNLLKNGDFESWSAGSAVAPDGWVLNNAAAARSATAKIGTYSLQLTGTGSGWQYAYQAYSDYSYFKGRTVTFGVWGRVPTTPVSVQIKISDDVSGTAEDVALTTTWQFFTVTRVIDSSATALKVILENTYDTSNVTLWDGAILVEGSVVPAFAPRPLYDEGTVTISNGNVGIGTATPENKLNIAGILQFNDFYSGYSDTELVRLSSQRFSTSISVGRDLRFISGIDSDSFSFSFGKSNNASNNLWLNANFTPVMTIKTGSGNVGIGTTSPLKKLHVGSGTDNPTISDDGLLVTNDGTTNVAIIDSTNNVELLNYAYSGGGIIGTVTDHNFAIRTNNLGRITILNTGNVGIGNSSPANILSFAIASATDPIADSWLTYPSDSKHKDIKSKINDDETKYLDQAKKWVAYNWTRKPIVTKEEAVSALGGKKKVEISSSSAFKNVEVMDVIDTGEKVQKGYTYDENGTVVPIYVNKTIEVPSGSYTKKLKSSVTFDSNNGKFYEEVEFTEPEIEAKKTELALHKATLPKFTTERVGALMDDPKVPEEVLVYDEHGTVVGYDLQAFILYQQELIRELAVQLDKKANKN